MRIAIFGAGGVGGYFGACLAQAGGDVTFIARGAHLAALRERGLTVSSVDGDFVLERAAATDDPASLGPVDAVVVAVKSWQVEEAAREMAPLVGPDTMVLPLLNGVEAPDQLAAGLGTAAVLGGLCGILAWREGPGHVRHAGIDPFIQLGELDNADTPRIRALAEALDASSRFAVSVPSDIHVALWRKFVFIAPMSGLGAATRAPIGAIRELPETRSLLERCIAEAVAVGRARGVALADDCVAQTMRTFDSLPAQGTASMQRDIMAGRPSELEAQNGAVVRLGAELGVETPVNDMLYACLLPQERAARG